MLLALDQHVDLALNGQNYWLCYLSRSRPFRGQLLHVHLCPFSLLEMPCLKLVPDSWLISANRNSGWEAWLGKMLEWWVADQKEILGPAENCQHSQIIPESYMLCSPDQHRGLCISGFLCKTKFLHDGEETFKATGLRPGKDDLFKNQSFLRDWNNGIS